MGAVGGAARGSLVNSRWVGSGYGRWHGRWVGGSLELSVTVVQVAEHLEKAMCHLTEINAVLLPYYIVLHQCE